MRPDVLLSGLFCALIGSGATSQQVAPAFQPSQVPKSGVFSRPGQHPVLGRTRGLATEIISITPLDDVKLDAVGIVPAAVAGLPADFWGNSDSARLAKLLRPHYQNALPGVVALTHLILLTELPPPPGDTRDGDLLLARIDHLLDAGALDQAEALIERADTRSPRLFRRWFDVSLLTGRANRACNAMLRDPGLTPTLKARVFCLFRSGDWAAAALTLRSGSSLGRINDTDEQLLTMFLDPDLFIGEPDPPAPETLTPLLFTMREALALPRTGQTLPLAYLHNDLLNYAGWRNRLQAAERLVRAQAIPQSTLIEAYNEARASASGGIWERVRAVQALRSALADQNGVATSRALVRAYRELGKVGLQQVLAQMVFPRISKLELTQQADAIRYKLALQHRDRQQIAREFPVTAARFPVLNAVNSGNFSGVSPRNDLEAAILAALQNTEPNDGQTNKGQAVLLALKTLAGPSRQDPPSVEKALSTLMHSGLAEQAADIAIDLLLLEKNA